MVWTRKERKQRAAKQHKLAQELALQRAKESIKRLNDLFANATPEQQEQMNADARQLSEEMHRGLQKPKSPDLKRQQQDKDWNQS